MRIAPLLIGLALGLSMWGCARDNREWMKVDQKYTLAEFQRDYTECSRGGTVDETCMRSRGWVDVKTGKPEEKPQPESYRQQRGKGYRPGQTVPGQQPY